MSDSFPADAQFLLTDLLRDVSRSFYLTLRLLPGSIRNQIGLAYLLARATDTIADTGAISVEQRLETLQQLRSRILGEDWRPLSLPELRAHQGSPGERVLLERVDQALKLLREMEAGDRQSIQRVLETITSGQELDLRRFGKSSATQIGALQTRAELDDYTYRVAGCVGEFWTRICFRHLSAPAGLSENDLIGKGIRFGQGLQLVNILRDVPEDLRLGRCYLPEEELAGLGLRPGDLLDPLNEQRLRPLYQELLAQAEGHLSTAWSYVLDLPRSWMRVRVACALPVLIGVKTLNKLRTANVLNPDMRVKVSRQDVKRIMRASILFYPVNSVWKNLPARVVRT
jgi:farnesyl-diphosphate farnesyltransferase